MNLTFHIIRKDLRALRWGLLLWVAACCTHLGLRLAQVARGEFAFMTPFWLKLERSNRWDYLLVCFLSLLLIPALFHLDSLRGRLAFWKTLPISRWRLLMAKLCTLLAFFVLLPLLCEFVYLWRAQLTSVLPHALADWAWRFLPGVAAAALGCLLARSLVTAIPGVALTLWAAVGLLSWPFGGPAHKVPAMAHIVVKPAPEGVKASIDPTKFSFRRAIYDLPPESGKSHRSEERLRIAMEVSVRDLPPDVLINWCDLHFSSLMINGQNFATAPEAKQSNALPAALNGLPIQESHNDFGSLFRPIAGPRPTDAPWELTTGHLKIAAKDLPKAGVPAEGKVRVSLVRPVLVATLPLTEGATWQAGLHRLTLSDVSPSDAMTTQFTSNLTTVLADPRAKTGGLDLSQPYYLWAEHLTLPYRKAIQRIPVEGWQRPSPWPTKPKHPVVRPAKRQPELAWKDGSVDVTRSQKRTILQWSFTPTELMTSHVPAIALARFAEEQAQTRNWRLAVVRYEPAGIIELPFKTVIPRPLRQRDEDEEAALSMLKPAVPLDLVLAEIKVPPHPTHAEAEAAFAKILAAVRTTLAENHHQEDALLAPENVLLQKLAALGPENIDVLLAAASAETRGTDGLLYRLWPNSEWAATQGHLVSFFWSRVLQVAGDLARPEDKALFLKYHSPVLDLLPALETMGWRDEALPAMRAAALMTPVPVSWQEVIASQPGEATRAVLLAQIRLGAMPAERAAQWIQRGVLPARETASILWETAVAKDYNISSLLPAFKLAAGYGVEIIPRDLRRIQEHTDDTDDRAFIQNFSLRSDCPPTMAAAATWLEQNATQLAFNETTGRYELPGAASLVPNVSAWGKFSDPLFGGKLAFADGAVTLTTAVHSQYPIWATPKLEREFEGDFTYEVVVAPAFTLAPGWNPQQTPDQAAGLLAELDDHRYLRWEQALSKKVDGHELREELVRGGGHVFFPRRADGWDPLKPTTLRISRHGTVVMTAWRQGQDTWKEKARELLTWTGKMRLSCFVTNNTVRPFSARFSDLHAVSQSAPPLVAMEQPKLPEGVVTTESGTDLGAWGKFQSPVHPAAAKLDGNTLAITVAPGGGDFRLQERLDAPRVLSEVEGDFTLEATIAPTAKKYWSSAELLLLVDSENFFRVGFAMGYGDKPQLSFERAEGGHLAAVPSFRATRDLSKPLRLRLQRQGHLLTISYQQDGGEWTTFYPLNIRTWPTKIQTGVVAINTSKEPFTAVFSNFLLTKTPEPKP